MRFSLQTGIPFTKHKFSVKINRVLTLDNTTMGINSNVGKDAHVFMGDWDDRLTLTDLKKELKKLIKRFNLGDLEIYESSFNKYIVFGFFERLSYKDLMWILHETNCDSQYKMWRMIRDEATLRVSEKAGLNIYPPKYVCTIKGNKKELRPENKKLMNFVHSELGVENA